MVPAGCQGHVVRPSHLTGKHRASLVVRVTLVKSNNSPPTSLTGCRVVSLGFGIKKKCKPSTTQSVRNLSDSKAGSLQAGQDQEPDPVGDPRSLSSRKLWLS